MIVVTGTPRSGSSMTMQTLKLLGIPVAMEDSIDMSGVAHLPEDVENRDVLLEHNPKGYWNLPDHLTYDYLWSEDGCRQGEAIKVLAPAFSLVPMEKVEKIILCYRRDQIAQTYSLSKLVNAEYDILPNPSPRRTLMHYLRMSDLRAYIKHHQDELDRFLGYCVQDWDIPVNLVCFEEWYATPRLTIKELKNFIGSDADITAAVENINTDSKF